MKQRSGFAALLPSWLLLGGLLGLPAACRAPELHVATEEPAQLFLDGVSAGPAPLRRPLPYYGTLVVTAVDRSPEREQPRREATVHVDATPPAPLWLFPFDFLIELTSVAFSGIPEYGTTVLLPPREQAILEGRMPRLAELNERARAAAAAR